VFSQKQFRYQLVNISGTTKLKNVKIKSGPAESTNLIFQNLIYNPVSGQTAPLRRGSLVHTPAFSLLEEWASGLVNFSYF
jgi:hypothetical protein